MLSGQLRALIVDDNAYARAISGAGLRQLGIGTVDEATGGAAAILQLLCAPYDLVLLDWYMPDIGGAGLMQVLRDARFGQASATPVILMTAYASEDNVARAHELGVNDVLTKPFSVEQLGAALKRVLGAEMMRAAGADEVFL